MAPAAQAADLSRSIEATDASLRAPKSKADTSVSVFPWYNRPAGAFYSNRVVNGNVLYYVSYYPHIFLKPYASYTWRNASVITGAVPSYTWRVQHLVTPPKTRTWADVLPDANGNVSVSYGIEGDTVPQLVVSAGDTTATYLIGSWQYKKTGNIFHPAWITSNPTTNVTYSNGKTYRSFSTAHYYGATSNRLGNANKGYSGDYKPGATPHGTNTFGWWFGKNDSGVNGWGNVFEQPEHPYELTAVACQLTAGKIHKDSTATLTATVYRMQEQPPYNDSLMIIFRKNMLTPLATATATLDSASVNKLLVFNLDESIDVDFPVYVEITGINGQCTVGDTTINGRTYATLHVADNNLLNGSLIMSTDQTDEGFGEQAFLHRLIYWDSKGAPLAEPYELWCGLNNFFSNVETRSAFDIFIETMNPYMVFNEKEEDGTYNFPPAGGTWTKTFGSDQASTIQVLSSKPSADWTIATTDGAAVPSWLTLSLADQVQDSTYAGIVNVTAAATALPAGTAYRSADVKFAVKGANLTYHFTQGSTGITATQVTPNREVRTLRYYNLTGQQSAEPFEGVNIQVVTYTDGTRDVTKVIK